MISQDIVVENLLFPIWRGVDENLKERYKKDIWEQFENNIRSAAYTAKLTTFLGNIKRQMGVTIQAQYLERINTVVAAGEDSAVLNWLRDETTYLVMCTRILNQDRKEAAKNGHLGADLGEGFYREDIEVSTDNFEQK